MNAKQVEVQVTGFNYGKEVVNGEIGVSSASWVFFAPLKKTPFESPLFVRSQRGSEEENKMILYPPISCIKGLPGDERTLGKFTLACDHAEILSRVYQPSYLS